MIGEVDNTAHQPQQMPTDIPDHLNGGGKAADGQRTGLELEDHIHKGAIEGQQLHQTKAQPVQQIIPSAVFVLTVDDLSVIVGILPHHHLLRIADADLLGVVPQVEHTVDVAVDTPQGADLFLHPETQPIGQRLAHKGYDGGYQQHHRNQRVDGQHQSKQRRRAHQLADKGSGILHHLQRPCAGFIHRPHEIVVEFGVVKTGKIQLPL